MYWESSAQMSVQNTYGIDSNTQIYNVIHKLYEQGDTVGLVYASK